MSCIQLSFSIRVSSGVKSVHLAGSWDNYTGQLPLALSGSSSKSWKGTFNFKNSTLAQGQRYWYYYIIDGYHFSHNPSVESTVEPTTGRALNILDVPKSSSSKSSKSSSSKHSSSAKSSKSSSSRGRRSETSSRHSAASPDRYVAKGRPLSAHRIRAPRPVNPSATKNILEYNTLERIEGAYAEEMDSDCEDIYAEDYAYESAASSGVDYRSDLSSPSSDMSGYSTPDSDVSSCSCERYGITRSGDRVKIDCQGVRCGADDSDCSDSEAEYETEEVSFSRRHGMVIAA